MTEVHKVQIDHLKPIDGLRGYLALWVALGHALQTSGFLHLPGPMNVIMQGSSAVQVFMIISGFVITHLLLKGRETYPQYITRRFFRLYPVYIVGCVFGFFVMPMLPNFMHSVPWHMNPEWQSYTNSAEIIAYETQKNTIQHLIVHISMLQGLIPGQVLPAASVTFLPAAWSISLEWQFYIIAPIVILSLKSGWKIAAVALAFLLAYFFVCNRTSRKF